MQLTQLSRLAAIAAPQSGTFSAQQARSTDLNREQLRRLERAGAIVRTHPNVWRFAAGAETDLSRVWSAWLEAGGVAVVSHESALRLHGLRRLPPTIGLTLPAGINRRVEGVHLHRVCDLFPHHLTEVDGLPVTTLPRSLLDSASRFSGTRLGDLIDEATIRLRLTTIEAIGACFGELNRRGRRGVPKIWRELGKRSNGQPTNRSTLEGHLDELLAQLGLTYAVHEHPLPTAGGLPGLVDRALPDAMLILEVDGRRWHARERDMARDRARDREAARFGWQTLRILDEELTERREIVAGEVLDAYRMRLEQLRRPA